MKNERRSQLDKFTAKLSKQTQDTEAMKRAELERKQKLLDRVNGIVNADKLEDAGGIEEAAAVFSYAGIETFSSMMMNSFRSLIREELPEIVRRVYREERALEMRGQLKGVQNRLEEDIRSIMDELHSEAQEAPESEAESVTEQAEEEVAPPIRKRGGYRKRGILAEEVKIIAGKLKAFNGKPVKLKALVEMTPEINFGLHASSKLSNLKKLDENIINIGKGIYAYRQE